MEHANKKIVILITQSNDIELGIQLLQANGFEVELRPPSKRETLLTTITESKTPISRAELLVDKTRELLSRNLARKISLDNIARQVGSNRSQLAMAFKSIVGKGVFEWLREQKLKQAKMLLLETNLTIQCIALEVGFDNQANFSSVYKKHYGISPREQRLGNESNKNTDLKLSLTHSKVSF